MKKVLIAAVTLSSFLCISQMSGFAAVTYDPDLYTYLSVETDAYDPSINDNGEIVYIAYDDDSYLNVYSSLRGKLTSSTTGNIRFPDINNNGEVVYADLVTGSGLRIFSTARGQIPTLSQANMPSINDSGEIAYSSNNAVYTDLRGLIAQVDDSTTNRIANNGEIVYSGKDGANVKQIFSTTRGQITTDGGQNENPSINNDGYMVYVRDDGGGFNLMTEDGIALNKYPVGAFMDINNYGDIVANMSDPLNNRGLGLVLMTQRPEYYPQFSEIQMIPNVVPEPASMALFGLGAGALALAKRKKKLKQRVQQGDVS